MIELPDRWLTERGISVCDPRSATFRRLARVSSPTQFRVTEVTDEVREFNRFASDPIEEPTAADFVADPPQTILPPPYSTLDVDEYVTTRFLATKFVSSADKRHRWGVLCDELDWFWEHGRYDMLRTLVYVVDTLHANSVPWGVGRGSSVNSYVLFLIGVHNIDPIAYNLDWREFMR